LFAKGFIEGIPFFGKNWKRGQLDLKPSSRIQRT
jgi:hypothetical protein